MYLISVFIAMSFIIFGGVFTEKELYIQYSTSTKANHNHFLVYSNVTDSNNIKLIDQNGDSFKTVDLKELNKNYIINGVKMGENPKLKKINGKFFIGAYTGIWILIPFFISYLRYKKGIKYRRILMK